MRRKRSSSASDRRASPEAGLDCATAFRKIAQGCVDDISVHHGGACAGGPEEVHQIRVAFTRLRAVVSFFASIAADVKWLRLKKEIAWLDASLGAARDSDVMLEYSHRKRYRAWAKRRIGDDLDQRRIRDQRRLVRCLHAIRFQRLMGELSGWVKYGASCRQRDLAAHGRTEPLNGYCARELDRRCRRLARKGRHLLTMGGTRRHRLRIRAKRLRYVLEALTGSGALCAGGKYRHMRRRAKRLQQVLGDLRDLKRFAELEATGNGKAGKSRPPGYRRQREKLLNAAVEACRGLS